MGLDIYLYKNKDLEASKARRQEYEDRTNQIWEEAGEYKEMTDEQKDEIRAKCKAVAEELNLEEYGSDPAEIKVEQDSTRHRADRRCDPAQRRRPDTSDGDAHGPARHEFSEPDGNAARRQYDVAQETVLGEINAATRSGNCHASA